MTTLQQALLLGLLGAYCWLDWCVGFLYCNRPIVLAPLVGLIMGDLQTGLLLGAVLETYFLGTVVIGGYQAPDAGVSSILATAFAINSGMDTDAALLLAVPIAVIMTSLQNVLWASFSFTSKIADRYAEKGEERGVYGIMFLEMFLNTMLKFCVVFFAWLYGNAAVEAFINQLPPVVLNGMAISGGVLPAIGLAILVSMIMNKKNAPYFFLGFAAVGFFGISTIGVAVLGVILILLKFDFSDMIQKFKSSDLQGTEVASDDF
jgi:fructoselysine and glucoselysine-specific PTS system IIC component